jgi:MFS family permease
LDGIFFFAALIMFSREVIIPGMISELSESAFLVGLVPSIVLLGVLLPQVFYAKAIEGLAFKKRRVLFWVVFQRIGWGVFLISLFIHWGPVFTLTVFFTMQAVSSFGSGFLIPLWTDWYAKTTPEHLWGRILGYRRASPAVLGVGLGFLIDQVMDRFAAPARYQILCAGAIVFFVLSSICVALVHEEEDTGLPHQRDTSWREYLRGLGWILLRRRDFRRFMAASLLVCVPLTVIVAFLTRYGLTYPEVEDAVRGTFTKVLFVSSALGAFVGGILSDRRSAIAPFLVFPLFGASGAALAALSPHPLVVSLAFALYGFAFGIRMVVMLPAVFRFAGPHRRPTYTAVSFTLLSLPAALLPPLAGLLLDAGVLTFPLVFLGCAVLSVAGWLLFVGMPAPEPPPISAPDQSGPREGT